MSHSKEDKYEYNLLVTSPNFHQRILGDKEKLQVHWRTNYLRKYLSCGEQKNADKSCENFVVFPMQEKLPYECLPTGKQVLEYLFCTDELPDSESPSWCSWYHEPLNSLQHIYKDH